MCYFKTATDNRIIQSGIRVFLPAGSKVKFTVTVVTTLGSSCSTIHSVVINNTCRILYYKVKTAVDSSMVSRFVTSPRSRATCTTHHPFRRGLTASIHRCRVARCVTSRVAVTESFVMRPHEAPSLFVPGDPTQR